MKKRHFKKWFKKKIQMVVDDVEVEGLKIVSDKNKRSIFKYKIYYKQKAEGKGVIGFDEVFFRREKKEERNKANLEEEIIIAALHEVGHHKDETLENKNKEIAKLQKKIISIINGKVKLCRQDGIKHMQDRFDAVLVYQIDQMKITVEKEKKAWDIAYELNKKHAFVPKEIYVFVQEKSLKTYEEEMGKVIEKYEVLEDKEKFKKMLDEVDNMTA